MRQTTTPAAGAPLPEQEAISAEIAALDAAGTAGWHARLDFAP